MPVRLPACRGRRTTRGVVVQQCGLAIDHDPLNDFTDAVRALKPNGIVGVSTIPKLFNQRVIEAMAQVNERPIIFPYSNPPSRSECTAKEAYRWSQGRAVFASASPFPPIEGDGKRFVPGQGNNVYITLDTF